MGGPAPRRIAICGVAGYNRGDDAIAMAMATGILARLPDARVDVAMLRLGSIAPTRSIRPFLAVRSRPAGLLGLTRAIARADLVILGGGSLVQDKFGASRIKGVLGYAWLVSALAGLFRTRLITAPLGIDHLHREESAAVARDTLGRARRIFVRDGRSRDNLLSWATPAMARVTERVCDPAFALTDTRAAMPPGAPYVALSPAFEGEFDALVAETFARVARLLIERLDRDVVVVAMDDRPHEDGGKLEQIAARLDPPLRARVTLAVPPTLDEASALLRGAEGVVAMRLHAIILSYAHVPVACLSRTTKTEALMADYAVPGAPITATSDAGTVAETLVAAVQDWPDQALHRRRHAERLAELDRFFNAVVTESGG